MRLSKIFLVSRRCAPGLPRWTLLLAALTFVATLASAQTNAPGETNREDVARPAPGQSTPAQPNEAPTPEDRAQPDSPPAPTDGSPGMMPPPPGNDTADVLSAPAAGAGSTPEAQRAAAEVSAKSSPNPAFANPPNLVATNPSSAAKPEAKSGASVVTEPRPTAPAIADFSAFKIISDRNIFDPNRSPRRTGGTPRRARTVESVTLVGIMSYEKGDFAFFNGTSAEYKKVLKSSDTIVGYKLASIGANSVKLSSGKQEVELKIGSQLRREEEGEWTLSTQSEVSTATPAASSASAAKPSEAGAASDGAESEILKKLMQRREQE